MEALRAELDAGRSVVLALGHMGNWDLAGAWATRHVAPVTTVAERLEPERVFAEFLAFREGIGMEIIPLDRSGGEVFRRLVVGGQARRSAGAAARRPRPHRARSSRSHWWGETARVAAGPAALASRDRRAAVPGHHPLRAARRRPAAGRRLAVGDRRRRSTRRCPCPTGVPRAEAVAALTQGWVDVVAAGIAAHPEDWHMLQKVFVADLDPARYATTRRGVASAAVERPVGAGRPGGRASGAA